MGKLSDSHLLGLLVFMLKFKHIQNQDPSETPLQRFKRLENELLELKRDISQMENNENGEIKPETSFDVATLTKQLETLQKQINSSHLQSIGARVNSLQIDNKAKK